MSKLRDSDSPMDGALSRSLPKGIVTGNSGAGAESADKPGISESGMSPKDSTLPKWLATNPEILAGQLHDLLALMQTSQWFVYLMPVTVETAIGLRTALRITISPPMPVTIGAFLLKDGNQTITINDVPVTQEAENEKGK